MTNLERYHEKAVKERIITEAHIEDFWYITSSLKRDITALSPFISLNESDNYEKIKEDSIRIGEPGKKPWFLAADETSIIKPLADQELRIVSIYTKDKTYKEKIDAAIKSYEDSCK
ncbi:MAG TPA: hypothetical protein PKM50_02575 [Methanoregula sp.]|nr:hypothetical protein [Methanoregula sp.]